MKVDKNIPLPRTTHERAKDQEPGWLPDSKYSWPQALWFGAVCLALTFLIGLCNEP